jgi:hypothetical protein
VNGDHNNGDLEPEEDAASYLEEDDDANGEPTTASKPTGGSLADRFRDILFTNILYTLQMYMDIRALHFLTLTISDNVYNVSKYQAV